MSTKAPAQHPDDILSLHARELAQMLAVIGTPRYGLETRQCYAQDLACRIGWDWRRLLAECERVRRELRPENRCAWLSACSWLVGEEERLPRWLPEHEQQGYVPTAIGVPLFRAVTHWLGQGRAARLGVLLAAAVAVMPHEHQAAGRRLAATMEAAATREVPF